MAVGVNPRKEKKYSKQALKNKEGKTHHFGKSRTAEDYLRKV